MTENTPFEQVTGIRLPPAVQRRRLNYVIRTALTEIQRDTLLAYYIEELTLEQIAQRRGVHKSTVWRTLKRAEARLKKYLT